jgi:Cdc6-like AAA superfamily ATPase
MSSLKSIKSTEFEKYLFEGNPFISALEDRVLSEDMLEEELNERSDLVPGFAIVAEHNKELALGKRFYVLPPQGLAIYKRILQLIRMGYLNRNPATDDYDKHLHKAGLDASLPETLDEAGTSMLFRGPTGMGKTKLTNTILSTLPSVVTHDASQLTGHRSIKQVLWVKIDMEVVGTRAGLITAIAEELDKRLQIRFAPRIDKLKHLTNKRHALIKYCRMACLGLLVIDDAQWALKKYKTDDDRKVSNEFIEQLFNQLGVPMVFIITPDVDSLKSMKGTTTRRISHNGNYEEPPYEVTEEFWIKLIGIYFEKFLSVPETALDKDFFNCIHYYTDGNVGALKRIVADFLQRGLPNHASLLQCIDIAYRNTNGEIEELKLPFKTVTKSTGKHLETVSNKKGKNDNKNLVCEITDKNKAIAERAKREMQQHSSGGRRD